MPIVEPPPRDRAVSVASVGSALLAAPAVLGAGWLLLWLVPSAFQSPASDLPFFSLVALVAVVVASGFWLLRGYWQIRLGEADPDRQSRFWASSAAYNGIVALAAGWAVTVQIGSGLVPAALPLALLAWAGWMVWIGLRRSVFARSL